MEKYYYSVDRIQLRSSSRSGRGACLPTSVSACQEAACSCTAREPQTGAGVMTNASCKRNRHITLGDYFLPPTFALPLSALVYLQLETAFGAASGLHTLDCRARFADRALISPAHAGADFTSGREHATRKHACMLRVRVRTSFPAIITRGTEMWRATTDIRRLSGTHRPESDSSYTRLRTRRTRSSSWAVIDREGVLRPAPELSRACTQSAMIFRVVPGFESY